jgi:hypothetical protein
VVDPTPGALVLQVVAVEWIGLRLPLVVLLQDLVQVTQAELVVTSRLGLTVQVAAVAQELVVRIIQGLMVVLVVQDHSRWEMLRL